MHEHFDGTRPQISQNATGASWTVTNVRGSGVHAAEHASDADVIGAASHRCTPCGANNRGGLRQRRRERDPLFNIGSWVGSDVVPYDDNTGSRSTSRSLSPISESKTEVSPDDGGALLLKKGILLPTL